MFRRILIANRGEIACRIARTCRVLKIEYVAVYTDVDAGALHVQGAAASVRIGAGPASQSYLDGALIIAAALDTGCEAVHPGYGFLSENREFAADVAAAGLIFIGPRPETIAALGDKARAKSLMHAAGVPVVPGGAGASDDPAVIKETVGRVGLPVLLKPSAGGGGKGMRVVASHEELGDAVASAIRVARSSFGDGRLIVERYIEQPRHIEVQVFGDAHGNVVHLFERECSLQRRYQKVVEEAPAPNLPDEVRRVLVEAAVRGARSVYYLNAGTFEFIVGKDLQFYFLEVNTRLQVEHPVTECITGLDLVEWQLRVAAGELLPLQQNMIRRSGHAMECRIYAEDPARDFMPAPGRVSIVRWPNGIRVEAGVQSGSIVPPFYDPMVAKLVAYGPDRASALVKLSAALNETVLLGLTTNINYLRCLLADPEVKMADVHTRYLDEHSARFVSAAGDARAAACAAVLGIARDAGGHPWAVDGNHGPADRATLDPQAPLGRVRVWSGETQWECALQARIAHGFLVGVVGSTWEVQGEPDALGVWTGSVGPAPWLARWGEGGWELQVDGESFTLTPVSSRVFGDTVAAGASLAPMSGTVVAIPVAVGDRVHRGETVAVVEAMKMEHSVVAAADGAVLAIAFRIGDPVRAGELIVDIDPVE